MSLKAWQKMRLSQMKFVQTLIAQNQFLLSISDAFSAVVDFVLIVKPAPA